MPRQLLHASLGCCAAHERGGQLQAAPERRHVSGPHRRQPWRRPAAALAIIQIALTLACRQSRALAAGPRALGPHWPPAESNRALGGLIAWAARSPLLLLPRQRHPSPRAYLPSPPAFGAARRHSCSVTGVPSAPSGNLGKPAAPPVWPASAGRLWPRLRCRCGPGPPTEREEAAPLRF